MFTGIVEELGEVLALHLNERSARITVAGPLVTSDASEGASIAVNGICLTVIDFAAGAFTADVMAETLQRTALAGLAVGDRVNLERPVTVASRLGGHIVQGHVDGVGSVTERIPGDRWEVVRITCEPELLRYLVAKGSVAVDGVSLTVVDVDDATASFTISLIPQTLASTTLGHRAVGDRVNLEVDVLAKYVARLTSTATSPSLVAAPGHLEVTP